VARLHAEYLTTPTGTPQAIEFRQTRPKGDISS